MIRVKIKTKKQDNGLWGTPNNCYKINGSPPKDHDLNILASAILIAIDEQYNIKFSVKYMDYTEDGFYVILTDDNPRTEDEKQIMNDILAGVKTKNYEVIFSRREAIKKGISLLKENDILLILGKGHEDYQIIGHDKIHFSDKEIVLENI